MKSLFLLIVALYIGSGFGQQATRPLPGVDFVGFGYDIRFEDPDDALTLPILDWAYDSGKTYFYPPAPNTLFKVPDEVFVRTLSFTESNTRFYESSKQWKDTTRLKIGLDASTISQGDGKISAPEQKDCELSEPSNPTTVNGNDPCEVRKRAPAVNTALLDLQANTSQPNATFSGSKVTKSTSRAFSLGTKFSFVDEATKNADNWVVEIAQQNQMYQIIVDKRRASLSMQGAISELRGKSFAEARELYFDFLEKWGTHYIISAVIGGSVEVLASVEKTGETQATSVIANLSLALNTTSTTNVTTETEIQNFVADAPECANIGKKGWILDKAKSSEEGTTVCEEPLYTGCHVSLHREDWQFGADSDRAKEYVKGTDTTPNFKYCTVTWRHCYWYGGCHWHSYDVIVAYTWPTFVTSDSTNTLQLVSTNQQNWDNILNKGYKRDFVELNKGQTTFRPNLIRFTVQATTDNPFSGQGVFKFVDTGADFADDRDDLTCFTFQLFNQRIGLRTDNKHTSGTFTGFKPDSPLTTPHEITLIVDWAAATVDVWIKDLGPGTHYRQKQVTGIPFIQKCTKVSRLILWNEDRSTTTTFGPIDYCNPADGAKYNEVPKMTAVASVTTTFKQSITSTTDFAYQTSFSNATLTQTNNWKLRGGDTSKLDFLDPNKARDVINIWKNTVYNNPAAVAYSVKPISSLFPAPLLSTDIDLRAELDAAISSWLLVKEEIDTPGVGPQSCDTEGNCEPLQFLAPPVIDQPGDPETD